jgi:peptidyl-prolyl cis-trans isomerase C
LNVLRNVLLSLLLASCAKPRAPADRQVTPDASAAVAQVGKVKLTEADLQRAIAREPGATPERFQTPEARRELTDGLVRFELLAQAAERAGLTQDPDAIHAQRQIAVTKLVNQTLGAVATPDTISRADVEHEYLARQASEFTLPPAARVRHIRVSDPKLAGRLVARARALAPNDDDGFAELAKANSEDIATRRSGGDLGFVDRSSRLPAALVEAALALQTPGQVTDSIAVDGGYDVLRLVSIRAAAVSSLAAVEEPLRQRMYRERRAKALDDLLARLRKETPVALSAPEDSHH